MSDKVAAVYAGTFDPITNGHRDIIERALKIFDPLIVAVAESTTKDTLFDVSQRRELILGAIEGLNGNISVQSFKGLLVDFVKTKGARAIVRGLRAVSDYEYESQMAMINRELADEIETVFIMTSRRSSFISASIVRQIARLGGDVSSLVPPNVLEPIKEIYRKKGE